MQIKFITRKIIPEDASEYLAFSVLLDNETVYRAYEPSERPVSLSEMEIYITNLLKSGNSMIFLAFAGDTLCGYIEATGGIYNRNRHSVHINLAVLKQFSGMGVASLLFKDLFLWAGEMNLHRIDLTVFTYNTPAINLYKKLGFQTEGIKKDSFRVNGSFVDEFIMAKIL